MRPQSHYVQQKHSDRRLSHPTSKTSWRWKWGSGAVFFVIAIVAICNTSWLAITTITVEGTQRIAESDVRALVDQQLARRNTFGFKQSNLVAFSKRQLTDTLRTAFPYVTFTVNKSFPHTLRVRVSESAATMVWRSGNQAWYVNTSGEAVQLVTGNIPRADVVNNRLLVVVDTSSAAVELGQQLIQPSRAKFLTDLAGEMTKKTDFEIAEFSLERPTADFVTAIAADDTQILFQLTDNPAVQIDRLKVLLDTKIKSSRVRYIDLRFGDKIFYR